MRRFTRPLVVGSLAFGLVAAAAAGTTFTIGSVAASPTTADNAIIIDEEGCGGTYAIDWSVSGGLIVGITATRTAPDPDDSLEYCANMPYAVYVSDGPATDDGLGNVTAANWVMEWYGTTDSVGDILAAATTPTVSGSLVLDAGEAVKIEIGPEAGFGAP